MGPWPVDSSKPNVRNGDTCGLDETYEFDECVEDHGPGALSLPTFIFGLDFICELDEEVQLFPTAPDGNPTALSVAFASEEAAQFGYPAVELSNG